MIFSNILTRNIKNGHVIFLHECVFFFFFWLKDLLLVNGRSTWLSDLTIVCLLYIQYLFLSVPKAPPLSIYLSIKCSFISLALASHEILTDTLLSLNWKWDCVCVRCIFYLFIYLFFSKPQNYHVPLCLLAFLVHAKLRTFFKEALP